MIKPHVFFNGTKQDFGEYLKLFTAECELTRRVDITSPNAYSFLIQTFKELASSLDDQSNGTHLEEVKTIMQQFTQDSITRASHTYNKGKTPKGTVLPYCVPKDNKRKVNHSSP